MINLEMLLTKSYLHGNRISGSVAFYLQWNIARTSSLEADEVVACDSLKTFCKSRSSYFFD